MQTELLNKYLTVLKNHFKNNLLKVFLYGSVARGEEKDDSDIDILVILKEKSAPEKESLAFLTYDFNNEYDSTIEAIAESETDFKYWKDSHPFYNNFKVEGKLLYAA